MKEQDYVFESEDKFGQQIDRIKTIEAGDNLRDTDWKQTVKSLANYEAWKRTRKQKISLQEIAKVNDSPFLQIAKACGIKNGQNEMLNEFVEGYDISKLIHPKKLNVFQRLLSNYDPIKNVVKMQGKLIEGKMNSRKKLQVNKISGVLDEKYRKVERRAKTQSASRGERRCSPAKLVQNRTAFREIRELNKLALLPAVCGETRSSKSSSNPQISKGRNSPAKLHQQNSFYKKVNTMFLTKDTKKESRFFRQQQKQKSTKKDYLQQIKDIVNRSDELLHGQSSPEPVLNLNVTFSQLNETKLQTFTQQTTPQKRKKYQHWPSYEKYSMQSDNSKTKSCNYDHLVDFAESLLDLPKELNQMIGKVQLEFKQQQQYIDREIIQNQKNSLQLRFGYKMKMERENYLRNVEKLAKCKKQYRIERDRQEVKANGITRVARVNPIKGKRLNKNEVDSD